MLISCSDRTHRLLFLIVARNVAEEIAAWDFTDIGCRLIRSVLGIKEDLPENTAELVVNDTGNLGTLAEDVILYRSGISRSTLEFVLHQ